MIGDAVQMRGGIIYLDIMWKPEEKDVENQLGAEQAKRKFHHPGNHEGFMKTYGFPLPTIFFFTRLFIILSYFSFQNTNFPLNFILNFDTKITQLNKPHHQILSQRVMV